MNLEAPMPREINQSQNDIIGFTQVKFLEKPNPQK